MTFPVDQKTTKKNAWQMPNSYLCTREDLEKDNGHLLVLVLKRSGAVSVKTVHKEYVTILLKGCWWNSQKADVQFSTLRAHCPEVDSKAEEVQNYQYTSALMGEGLKRHFSSTDCSEVISKGTQKESGEERHSKVEADDEFGLAMQGRDS